MMALPPSSLVTVSTVPTIIVLEVPPVASSSEIKQKPVVKRKDFVPDAEKVTVDQVKMFNDGEINRNTKRKTTSCMNRLEEFFKMKNVTKKIHEIPMPELDELLATFFLVIRKEDGEDYTSNSLESFKSTYDRVLKENNYPYSIGKSLRQGFPLTNSTLKSKSKRLKKEGKGNNENAAQPVSDKEIELLWQKRLLGNSSPQSIINTLWLMFTIHFGMRGVEEHYNLCWGDIAVKSDADGTEYLEFTERQTKTRSGATNHCRGTAPRVWATDDERDIVATYRNYASKRPHGASNASDPFYLATRTTPIEGPSDQWFLNQRIGMKNLGTTMKRMTEQCGIDRRLTNHSARKHLVQKLRDNSESPTDMQISGHKNVQSIITTATFLWNRKKDVHTF